MFFRAPPTLAAPYAIMAAVARPTPGAALGMLMAEHDCARQTAGSAEGQGT